MTNNLSDKVKRRFQIIFFHFLLILCFANENITAQIKITYEINNVFQLQNAPPSIVFPQAKMLSTLQIYNNYSIWADNSIFVEDFGGSEDLKMFVQSKLLYKLYNKKIMYLRGIANSEGEFILNKKQDLDWVVDKSIAKQILGFKCVKATAIKNGVKIEAWFTADLFYSDGPDLYCFNLPGTILELTIIGGKSYTAIDIEIRSNMKGDDLPEFKLEHKAKDEINNRYLNQEVPQHFIIKKNYPLNTWVDISVN